MVPGIQPHSLSADGCDWRESLKVCPLGRRLRPDAVVSADTPACSSGLQVKRVVRLVAVGISLVWIGAMFPAALQPVGGEPLTGWDLLTTGWRAASAGIWAWFANPLFVCAVCLLLIGRAQAAGVLAGLALVLGISSLASGALAARAGYPVPPMFFGAGFYLWLTALFSLWLWAWMAAFVNKMQQ